VSAGRSAELRVGLAGCGEIASYAHLRVLRHLGGARLMAVADPSPEARTRAQHIARVPVHDSTQDLVAREDVDAVVICAPTPLHADLAAAAARAGKHFYLEKPVATNAPDAMRVIDAAAQAGVVGAVGFNRRLHPLYEQAREVLRSGRIGPVRAVQMAFCEPTAPTHMPPWKLSRATGGGVLLDLASHHVDSLRWLLDDEVTEATASLSSALSEHDAAVIGLSTSADVEVQGFYSYRAGHSDFLEFLGERGTLRVDRFRPALGLRVRRTRGYGTSRGWLPPSRTVAKWRLQRPFRRVREVSFRRSLEAYGALVAGSPARVASLDDGLRCLDALLEAEASAGVGSGARAHA
jgi:myo-inositol 2-dehydrogenase/D-chiro-inositol 1-dehydrogenase